MKFKKLYLIIFLFIGFLTVDNKVFASNVFEQLDSSSVITTANDEVGVDYVLYTKNFTISSSVMAQLTSTSSISFYWNNTGNSKTGVHISLIDITSGNTIATADASVSGGKALYTAIFGGYAGHTYDNNGTYNLRFNLTPFSSGDTIYGGTYGNSSLLPFVILTVDGTTPVDTSLYTHIITSTPNDGEVITATSSFFLGYTGYLAESDLGTNTRLEYLITPFYQANSWTGGGTTMDAINQVEPPFFYVDYLNDFGDFAFATTTATTTFPIGMYNVDYNLVKGKWCLLGVCLSKEVIFHEVRTFTNGTTTAGDLMKLETTRIAGILAGSATSTATAFKECGITNFDFFACFTDLITYAFIPTPDAISYNVGVLKEDVLSKFPIGYVTDFYNIMSTTSTSSLTIINAKLPSALGVGTPALTLSLSHVLDPILNATTSQFNNESATSTDTLYNITSYYWKILVYLLAFLYLLGRVLGKGVIGNINPEIKHKKL